jgi:hypothetical protein
MSNETVTVKGASGATYNFIVYSWGTNFNPVGAVYLILRKQYQTGNYSILYIGQTSDLSDRFDNHHKQPCFDQNQKSHIGILAERSEARRLNIEADLLGNYKTACNF